MGLGAKRPRHIYTVHYGNSFLEESEKIHGKNEEENLRFLKYYSI